MLSKREFEVEVLALRGLSGKQIAESLNIKLSTVKMHLAAVYSKRGVKNRLELLTSLPLQTVAGNFPVDHVLPKGANYVSTAT